MLKGLKRFILKRSLHEPSRYPGESQAEYRARQQESKHAIKYRGRTIHVSKAPYTRLDGSIGFHAYTYRRKVKWVA